MRTILLAAAIALRCALGDPAHAETNGTAQEAKAMLQRAVDAVKANEPRALDAFRTGKDGFRDRDLYVFCARADGVMDAHIDPALMGRKIQDLYDLDGVAFGLEIMAVARPDAIEAVSYMWPQPGSKTPVEKVTFVTKVADQVCAVGFYK